MRIAVLLLVLMLVVALATDVDAWWGRRRRRRRRYVRRPSPRPSSNSCRNCRRFGRRSVQLDEEISQDDPLSLLDEKTFYDKWQPINTAAKSRQKRALKKLKYPRDCNSAKLQNFARKCGLCVTSGGSHIKVCDGGRQLTVIPHSVKSNFTCQNIINVLNGRCVR